MRLIDADKLSSEMEFVFENARGMTALAARLVWAFVEKADTVDSSDLISKQSAIDYFASNVFIIDTDGNCIEDENECRQVWTERFNHVT